MRYLLLHTPAWSPAGVRPALESAQIEAREARVPRELVVDERPTVFVLDAESRSIFPVDVLRGFVGDGARRSPPNAAADGVQGRKTTNIRPYKIIVERWPSSAR